MNLQALYSDSVISRRLIINVVLFSSAITVLISMFQLFWDYKTDIELIENQLQQVENVHLRSLTASLWTSDIKDMSTQAEGIMRLRDMLYLEVKETDNKSYIYGTKSTGETMSRSFPMVYQHRGRDIEIGIVTIAASLDGVYQRLLNKVITILISNGIKTFLVAIFMLFIFHRLVTRHLNQIADYSEKFDVNNIQPLNLERTPANKTNSDELDVLVDAIYGMQLRLKESLEKLHESTQHYRSLVESSYAIPWKMDIASSCFTYVGPQAKEILGYEPEEWYPENFWSTHIHPDDRDTTLSYCKNESAEGRNHEFEYRMIAKDGRIVWLRDDVTVVKENGAPARLQGYIFDITARKVAEDALQAAYEDLEDKVRQRTTDLHYATEVAKNANQAKTQFLSRMTHELRTPLVAVLGFSEVLEKDLNDNPKLKEYAHLIHVSGQHLLELINEVMDLSQIEMGKININIENIEFKKVVNEALMYIQPIAEQRGISIHYPDFANVRVLADKMRLKEVLLNLLSNAVKYNYENGSITIGYRLINQKMCRISVADTGPGLDDDQLALIYEPFSRVGAEYSEIEGTGIGLTISKKLTELMAGELTVVSETGKGTEFQINLPVAITGYEEDGLHNKI